MPEWTKLSLVHYRFYNNEARMQTFNMHEAKTHFSKLVHMVMEGDEVIIAIAGKPVAKLGPIDKTPKRRVGVLKGKFPKTTDDFDAPLPDDIIAEFEK